MSGYSDVTVQFSADQTVAWVRATGGSRRERAAGITARLKPHRANGMTFTRRSVSYSETYGFLSATDATYVVTRG